MGPYRASGRLRLPEGATSRLDKHTSRLLASVVPLTGVWARLGHGSIRTTQAIYSHITHGQDHDAALKWDEFQNQPTGGEPQPKGQVQ